MTNGKSQMFLLKPMAELTCRTASHLWVNSCRTRFPGQSGRAVSSLPPGGGHMSTTAALIWSSTPPIIWSVVQSVRSGTVDAMSMLVIAGIALSLIATLLGGSPRIKSRRGLPPSRVAIRDNAIPAITSMLMASSVRLRTNWTTLQIMGGVDDHINAAVVDMCPSARW